MIDFLIICSTIQDSLRGESPGQFIINFTGEAMSTSRITTNRGVAPLPHFFTEIPDLYLPPNFTMQVSTGVTLTHKKTVEGLLAVTVPDRFWCKLYVTYMELRGGEYAYIGPVHNTFSEGAILNAALTHVLRHLPPQHTAFLYGVGQVPGRNLPFSDPRYRQLIGIAPMPPFEKTGVELIGLISRK